MRPRYKNKRDFYKAEMEKAQADLTRKQTILDSVSKQFQDYKNKIQKDKEKSLDCVLYCSNCQVVYGALVPHGVSLKESGCAYCGVKNVSFLVRQVRVSPF